MKAAVLSLMLLLASVSASAQRKEDPLPPTRHSVTVVYLALVTPVGAVVQTPEYEVRQVTIPGFYTRDDAKAKALEYTRGGLVAGSSVVPAHMIQGAEVVTLAF